MALQNLRANGNLKHQASLRGKNKRAGKTYGKKAKKRWEKQRRANLAQQENSPTFFDNTDTPDDGPLVRLGEGIVVDWYENAYDIVFNGDSHDNMRGAKTYTGDLPVLEDPTVAVRKRHRQMRQNNGITLDDCLDEFEKEEILSEQDTWYCPRCKEHRRASKKFDLWKSPDILVVHLKRFSSSGFRRDKLDVLVDFPVEGLDLTQRVIDKEDGKQEIYDLIGVDNHYGGLGGGHYTAFAKSFMDGDWYEYNGMLPDLGIGCLWPELTATCRCAHVQDGGPPESCQSERISALLSPPFRAAARWSEVRGHCGPLQHQIQQLRG